MWFAAVVSCLWFQVVVQHVNIQGLGRTKEDLLGYEITDVFHAKNLIDVSVQDKTVAAPRQYSFIIGCLVLKTAAGDEEGTRGPTEAAATRRL